MSQPPEHLRRAAGRDRIGNVTHTFRAAFPEVPEAVVRGYLAGNEMLSLRRTARRILDIHAANYDRAVSAMLAGDPVDILGTRVDLFDEDAVAASLERRHAGLGAVALGRMVSRISSGERGI